MIWMAGVATRLYNVVCITETKMESITDVITGNAYISFAWPTLPTHFYMSRQPENPRWHSRWCNVIRKIRTTISEYVGSMSPPIFNCPIHSILSYKHGPRAPYPGLDASPKTAETAGL